MKNNYFLIFKMIRVIYKINHYLFENNLTIQILFFLLYS